VRLPRHPFKLGAVLALLVAAQFALRPRLGDTRYAPDFVLVALLLFAVRVRPMAGTVAGFLVGLVTDAVAPTAFGAATLTLTVTGYAAGWLKAVVFPENLLVTGAFVFAAGWLRDAVEVLLARQVQGGGLAWQLLVVSPLASLSTAAAAVATVLLFRGWLRQRPA